MIGPLRQHRAIPPIRTGYPLNGGRCPFSIVVPIARTNQVYNPSFETNTTNWGNTGVGTTIARSTEQQFYGAYSLKVTLDTGAGGSDDGAGYGGTTGLSTTAGTTYAISAKVKGVPGVGYALLFGTSTATPLARWAFKGTGRWQWVWLIYTETATATNRQIFIVRDGTGGSGAVVNAPFYIDGVQCEACETGNYWPTTYIDGDQQGLIVNQFPPAYLWNGTPHGSTSSRSGQTRAGGRVIGLSKFGLVLTAIVGLGLVPPQHQGQNFAVLDGSQYDRTRKGDRAFTLVGRLDAPDDLLLRRQRADLAALLDRDLIGEQQPLRLLYQTMDGCGTPTSDQAEITALYAGGLDGNHDNDYAQDVAISFTQKLPLILASGETGTTLTGTAGVGDADGLIRRSALGVWGDVAGGLPGIGSSGVLAITPHPNGSVYIGGHFTGAPDTYAVIYNPATNTFSTIDGTGTFNNNVTSIAVGPDGATYFGGSFVNADGIAAADFIASYSPTADAISAMGTGANGAVNAVAVGPNGTVYAGAANTTDFGGVANTNGFGIWNGSAWSAAGTGLFSGQILAILPIGRRVYIAGSFTQVGGVALTYGFAYWDLDTSTWVSIHQLAPNGSVISMVQGLDGKIYLGGEFTAWTGTGGFNANYHAVYDGVRVGPVGKGTELNGRVTTQVVNPVTGDIHLGGAFTTLNGRTLAGKYARLLAGGNIYIASDAQPPNSGEISALAALPDGTFYIGYDQGAPSTATVAGVTTVTVGGSARAYPTVIFRGPAVGQGELVQLINYTTGRAIYIDRLTISAGETIILNLDPANLSFVSTFQGDVIRSIVVGSNEADFFLQPGANSISLYMDSGTATIQWHESYVALDDLVLTP